MASNCDHNWVNVHETATEVTHRCSKCGEENTRPKQASA